MVSHKNYNLNVNEDFVMFLTSKLIMCFIDSFTSGVKSQPIAYLLIESVHTHTHTHTGFQECKGNVFFLKLGGAGSSFQLGSKISLEGCPSLDLTSPKVRAGVFNIRRMQLFFIRK